MVNNCLTSSENLSSLPGVVANTPFLAIPGLSCQCAGDTVAKTEQENWSSE
ncbi:MAG: hypothetical protein JJ891_14405 [Rhizobiaceae bacterium]|nr:hypothetical protein [Rhizobiaceae bacterium]